MPVASHDVWTADDLATLPDDGKRYEVIDGVLFVTPSPSLDHQKIVGRLYALLLAYCEETKAGCPIVAPSDVRFSRMRLVEPDIYVLALQDGKSPREVVPRDLLLTVEVLSPSTARADRVAKRQLYREEAVPTYWIVDAESRTIEVSTPADPRIEIQAHRAHWQPSDASRPFDLDLDAFFRMALDG